MRFLYFYIIAWFQAMVSVDAEADDIDGDQF